MQEQQKIVRLHSGSRSYSVYTRESTVRQEAAQPKRVLQPVKTREERIREERRKRWERNVRKHAIEREVRSRFDKANRWSRVEMAAISAVMVVMLAACSFLLYQQAAATGMLRTNSSLEAKYVTLVRDNNALSGMIETEIDYQAIYDYAVNTLGMKYPDKSQIVYYQKQDNGSVYQLDEIPQKSE